MPAAWNAGTKVANIIAHSVHADSFFCWAAVVGAGC